MKKFKAFTLIEVIIVISILSILTLLFLGISTDTLKVLNADYQYQKIISQYQNLFSKNLVSPYIDGKKYSGLWISFISGKNYFLYSYDLKNWNKVTFEAKVISIKLNGKNVSNLGILLKPYDFSCLFYTDNTSSLTSYERLSSEKYIYHTGDIEINFSFPKTIVKKSFKLNSDNCRY